MQIIAIGRMKDAAQSSLCSRYLQRIRPRPKLKEINPVKERGGKAKDKEAEAILQHVPSKAYVVALDGRGRSYDSIAFAKKIICGREKDLYFIIGGADGLSGKVLERADTVLSLGGFTWPHMLVRIMLVEQIYRAQTILLGHPYHREG